MECMIAIIKCGKFHKDISDILSILTIFAMNVGLIQSDIILWDNMYSDLCD